MIEQKHIHLLLDKFTLIKRKIKLGLHIIPIVFLYLLTVPLILLIRLIRPWFLVRWGGLIGARIGHFAANTELYLCEKDAGINVPKQPYIDLFYISGKPISNPSLEIMWKRILKIWPKWFLGPVRRVNGLIPGAALHEIGQNTQHDRDVHNLMDRFLPHLEFTSEEETYGQAGLRAMGISPGVPFVCLNVRDSVYLNVHQPSNDWTYHNYRDSDIQNYVLTAEELASRGYFVVRMGVKVKKAIMATNPKIIDYAYNGMRTDFMDIYLGAKCEFCISTSSGFDAIPYIFRRPIVYVNMVPLGYLFTFSKRFLGITKHHYLMKEKRDMKLSEIFANGVGFSVLASDYQSKGIQLIENTAEEIRDVVIEMVERLNNTWRACKDDEPLQNKFMKIFETNVKNPTDPKIIDRKPLHGEIHGRFGTSFLRNNQYWLE